MTDAYLDAWQDLRVRYPDGVEAGIFGLMKLHTWLEPAWLADPVPNNDRVISDVRGIRSERRTRLEDERKRAASVASADTTSDITLDPDAIVGRMLLASTREQRAADSQAAKLAAEDALTRLPLPTEPMAFHEICRQIGMGAARLSPLLSAIYLRQAICSNPDFLLDNDDDEEDSLDFLEAQIWYAGILKIAYACVDYDLAALGLLDIDTARILALKDPFVQATQQSAFWTYGGVWADSDTCSAIRRECRELARTAKSVAEYLARSPWTEIAAKLDRPGAATSDEDRAQFLIGANRLLAHSTNALLKGDFQPAAQSMDAPFLRHYPETEDFVWDWMTPRNDERSLITYLRTCLLKADALERAGDQTPVDDEAVDLLWSSTNAFLDNWLDQFHASCWSEDFDTGAPADWLFVARSRPFEGGAIAQSIKLDFISRMSALTRGSRRRANWGVDNYQVEVPRLGPAKADRLEHNVQMILQSLEALHGREDHSKSLLIDVKLDQEDIKRVLATAEHNRPDLRPRATKFLLRLIPSWSSLRPDSQKELVEAEILYRSLMTGTLDEAAAGTTAMLFAASVFRERRRDQLAPYISEVQQLRNEAAHPEEYTFDELKLSEMRAYVLGIGMDRGGVINNFLRTSGR